MKTRIPYTKPSITNLEVEYATDAVTNGWGQECYAYISRFEDLFKKHLNVRYAIATSSCTGALHMGMAALGIGPGDVPGNAAARHGAQRNHLQRLGQRLPPASHRPGRGSEAQRTAPDGPAPGSPQSAAAGVTPPTGCLGDFRGFPELMYAGVLSSRQAEDLYLHLTYGNDTRLVTRPMTLGCTGYNNKCSTYVAYGMGLARRGRLDHLLALGNIRQVEDRLWRSQLAVAHATSVWRAVDAAMGPRPMAPSGQVDP